MILGFECQRPRPTGTACPNPEVSASKSFLCGVKDFALDALPEVLSFLPSLMEGSCFVRLWMEAISLRRRLAMCCFPARPFACAWHRLEVNTGASRRNHGMRSRRKASTVRQPVLPPIAQSTAADAAHIAWRGSDERLDAELLRLGVKELLPNGLALARAKPLRTCLG